MNDSRIKLSMNNLKLEITGITFDDAGNYRCFATNGFITFNSYRIVNVDGMYNKVLYFSWSFIVYLYISTNENV